MAFILLKKIILFYFIFLSTKHWDSLIRLGKKQYFCFDILKHCKIGILKTNAFLDCSVTRVNPFHKGIKGKEILLYQ